MSQAAASSDPPILFVDLDGTLIRTDTLQEAIVLAVKSSPGQAARLTAGLLKGLGKFKRQVFAAALPAVPNLPYRQDVLDWLRAQKAAGRRLVLATATDRSIAEAVAAHLELFEAVIATDGGTNLKGKAKLAAMRAYCAEQGLDRFAYAGDSTADLAVWEGCAEIVAVAPSPRVRRTIERSGKPLVLFPRDISRPRSLLTLLRPKQWAKNLLVFVPMFLAHGWYQQPWKIVAGLLAFAAFSVVASAVYVFNDLLDVEADRLHPKKRRRPLASGAISAGTALPAAALLLAAGFGAAALLLPPPFAVALGLYFFLTTAYSTWWKRIPILDVIVLASLYALRVVAGGLATVDHVSEWLIAFSVFMFTSLAFIKRYCELGRLAAEGRDHAEGRGYQVDDLPLIGQCGLTSGYLAVVVFALYISQSPNVPLLYNPIPLWFICLFLLFWVSKMWLVAHRQKLLEDPVIYAMTNRDSLFTVVLAVGMVGLARWLKLQ